MERGTGKVTSPKSCVTTPLVETFRGYKLSQVQTLTFSNNPVFDADSFIFIQFSTTYDEI